jgi:hypothetical protein
MTSASRGYTPKHRNEHARSAQSAALQPTTAKKLADKPPPVPYAMLCRRHAAEARQAKQAGRNGGLQSIRPNDSSFEFKAADPGRARPEGGRPRAAYEPAKAAYEDACRSGATPSRGSQRPARTTTARLQSRSPVPPRDCNPCATPARAGQRGSAGISGEPRAANPLLIAAVLCGAESNGKPASLPYKQEVAGSSPAPPTRQSPACGGALLSRRKRMTGPGQRLGRHWPRRRSPRRPARVPRIESRSTTSTGRGCATALYVVVFAA